MADQFSDLQKSGSNPSPASPYAGHDQNNNSNAPNSLGTFSPVVYRGQVVSQLSNVTASPTRPNSNRSFNSEYSNRTSPLDSKLAHGDLTQNNIIISDEPSSKKLFSTPSSGQIFGNTKRKSLLSHLDDQQQRELQLEDHEDQYKASNITDENSFLDGLGSSNSELDDFEDFNPGSSTFQSDKDNMTETSLFNESTQHIVNRATSLKYNFSDDKKLTPNTTQFDDDSPIGVKKERSVIDSLKQEIFQLKLHIVLMETQLNSSSETGIAQLKSKLVESEAARIAMKNENERLRNTITTLGRQRSGNFEPGMATNDQIHDLEEELLAYETALGEAQEEQQLIKEYYEKELNQRDSEISEFQDVNENLSNRVLILGERNEELLQMIADGDNVNDSNLLRSLKNKGSGSFKLCNDVRFEDLLLLANGIKEKLIVSPLQRTPQNRSPSSTTSKKSNAENFEEILKEISFSVTKSSEDYRTLLSSSKGLQMDYDSLLEAYNNLKGNLDKFVLRTEAEAAIEEVENLLYEKEQDLDSLKNERSELWNDIKLVNKGLEEIELERNNLIELNTQLADKIDELTDNALTQDSAAENIDKLSRENADLRDTLEEKDNELQVLSVEYSNCETDLDIKTKEVKKLQDLIKSLRSGVTADASNDSSPPENTFSDNSDSDSVIMHSNARKTNSDDIVDYILSGIQQFYNKEANIDNMPAQFDELLESVKQFDEIAEQLQEASKINTDLTNMVEERESTLSDLEEQVKNSEKKEKDLNSKIEILTTQLEEMTSEKNNAQKELDSLKNEYKNHAKLQNDFDALKEKSKDHDKLQHDLRVLREKISTYDQLQEELDSLKKQRKEEIVLYKQNELTMETVKVELDHLKKELLTSNSAKNDLHSKVLQLEVELENSRTKNHDSDVMSKEIAELRKDISERANKIESLQERIETLEVDLESQIKLNCESQKQVEVLEENVQSLEIDLEAETALRLELTQAQKEYENLAEDLELLQAENLDLETRNSELSSEVVRLEADLDQIDRKKGDSKELNALRNSVTRLESAERRNITTIRELESKLRDLNVSKVDTIKKSSTLDDIARMITQQHHQQKDREVAKSSSMSKLLSPAATATIATTGGKIVGVTGTGIGVSSMFKQKAYQHMLDLEKEMKSLRDRENRLS